MLMPRSRVSPVYAHTHNALLDLFRVDLRPEERLPVQAELAAKSGASRTTVHRILRSLKRAGVVSESADGMRLSRRPAQKDFLPQPRTLSRREEVEQSLMQMLVQGRLKPGERFSELALARQHNVTTGTIREALLRLAGLGVFTKSVRKQWEVSRIDSGIINELIDVRILIETYALRRYFVRGAPLREKFKVICEDTRKLAQSAQPDKQEFFRLDADLHRTILESGHNRYLAEQFRFISFPIQIQFLHQGFDADFQRLGLGQHLAILEAIVAGKETEALKLLEHHLEEARRTLLKFEAEGKKPAGDDA
jgi:GntR family transcriptional regulator, transcriptional activator for L-galactonate catabolism